MEAGNAKKFRRRSGLALMDGRKSLLFAVKILDEDYCLHWIVTLARSLAWI